MRLQRAMYLKRLKEVTREHRPSLNGKRVGRGKKKGQIFFFLQTQMRSLVGFQKDFPHLLCVFQAFNLSLYLISRGTQLMFSVLEVKGEATEASASERETPTSAALSAPQSLAPSPHIPTRQLQKQQQYFTVNVIKMIPFHYISTLFYFPFVLLMCQLLSSLCMLQKLYSLQFLQLLHQLGFLVRGHACKYRGSHQNLQ